jgi:predicted outer membrane repeat protein
MGAMQARRVLGTAIVAIVAVLATASVASAADFSVNDPSDAPLANSTGTDCVSTNGGSSCTLRAAVQAADNLGVANPGTASTIFLPANTYALTIPPAGYTSHPACNTPDPSDSEGDGCDGSDPAHGDLDVLGGTTLTITGAGSGSTTINANSIDRAFAVLPTGSLSLSGVTIENGAPAEGPFCASGTSPVVPYDCFPSSGVTFGDVGGAIYNNGALTTTGDVVLRGNQAVNQFNRGSGGAIYADSGATALSLSGTSFTTDYAQDGSAIFDGAPVDATISNSTFLGNDAAGGNGTIETNFNSGNLNITGTTFSNNLAGNGGAIYWASPSNLTADGNTFTGNSADAGGVLYNEQYTHATSLSGDVVTNNSAYDAGVIYENDYQTSTTADSVTLNNDEIAGNSATYVGVGYFSQGAGPTSTNSSYVGNRGADGGVFYLADTSSTGQGSSLTNVTMSGNSSNLGGAIYISAANPNPLTMVNDTVAFNTASVDGGGIYGASYATAGTNGGVTNTVVAQNSGGDCGGAGPQFASAVDSGYNADGDSSCFGYAGHPSTDEVGVNTALSPAAENGGPNAVETVAEHAGGPTVNGGNNAACPAIDARGLARPLTAADPCDIGAFELLGAALSAANAAPALATTSQPFNETITAANGAAGGFSTGTTLVDQLPAGETLYGATPSQGSCSASGAPAKLSCALGLVAPGASVTVQLVVAGSTAGAVTNTATVSNDEGASLSASVTTLITAPAAPSAAVGAAPGAYTGVASGVSKNTATLSGMVVPGGQPTGFFFEFGTSSSYGESTGVGFTGSVQEGVLAALANLSPVTTYHYRLVAINDSGASYGADATFKTQGTLPGSLRLGGGKLAVRKGKLFAPLTCVSSQRCLGLLAISTRVQTSATSRAATVACTKGKSASYRIAAHKRHVVKVSLRAKCMRALVGNGGRLDVRITVSARSGQLGLVKLVTLVLK